MADKTVIKAAIITGLFGLITGVVTTLLMVYLPQKTNSSQEKLAINANGHAKEINLNHVLPDFTDQPRFEYDLANVEIKISPGDKVFATATLSTKDINTNKNMSGSLTGNGVYEDGMAYITYSVVFKENDIKWTGIAVLRMPRGGDFKGYWMTEDILAKGKFSFGKIVVDR
jgi:hypothetical protein